ncbi:Riboflavin transporter [Aphelenchoides besseyi]|nr:Riboflavin transporter [Aphelenchoides besseyi]
MEPKTRINPLIYLLVVWFGSVPWLGNYSTFVEMSILTRQLPEGWSLASVLIVVIQISSIGPLAFMILDRYFRIPIRHGIVIQIALMVTTFMYIPLIFAWDSAISVFGAQYSIVLISSIFVMGMIAIGSDIVFMPFMTTFDSVYLSAYFVGNNISSLLPSLLSIIQGTSTYTCTLNTTTGVMEPLFAAPRFSVNVYYMIIFIWVFGGTFCFYLLNNHIEWLKRFGFCQEETQVDSILMDKSVMLDELEENSVIDQTPATTGTPKLNFWLSDFLILFSIALIGAETNTILPSVSRNSILLIDLMYQNTYFWAVVIGTIIPLVGSFSAQLVSIRSTSFIVGLTVLCATTTIFVIILALQSPDPWLKSSIWGSILTVSLQTFSMFLCSFVRLIATEAYRDLAPGNEDRLFWAGLALQIGSFVGALIAFPSVNILNFFQDTPPC